MTNASSKLIEPEEGSLGTSDLQPVGQKHWQQPEFVIGICSGVGPVGLSPSPVESDGISRKMVSELVELQGTQLMSQEFPVDMVTAPHAPPPQKNLTHIGIGTRTYLQTIKS